MQSLEFRPHEGAHPGSRVPPSGGPQPWGLQNLDSGHSLSQASLSASLGNHYDVTTPREDGLFQWRLRESADHSSVHEDLRHRLLESLSQSVVESCRVARLQPPPQLPDKRDVDSRIQLGSRRYLVMLIVGYSAFLANGFAGGLGVLYVPLLSEFNTTSAQAALVQSMADFTIFGGGLVTGVVASHLGAGPSSLLGSVLSTVGCLASAFAPSVPTLIGTASLLTGAGLSLLLVADWAIMVQLAHSLPKWASVFLGLGMSLGLLCCPVIYSALLDAFGWRGVYLFIAAFNLQTLPGSLLLYFTLRGQKTEARKETRSWRGRLAATLRPDLLCRWRYVVYAVLQVPLFTTCMSAPFFVPDLATHLGLTLQQGAISLSLMGGALFLGRAVQGVILNVCRVSTLVQSSVALLGMAAVCPGFVLAWDFPSLLGASFAYGFFFGMVGSAGPQVAFEEVEKDESFATVVGCINFNVGVGDLLCGPFGGSIVDYTGSYNLAFYIATGMCATTAALQFLLKCSCRGRQLPHYARLEGTGREAANEDALILQKTSEPGTANRTQGKKEHYSTLQ